MTSSNLREALDERELVGDLAALVGDLLLCVLELLGRGTGLEGNLSKLGIDAYYIVYTILNQ